MLFKLISKFKPKGDQPRAIKQLTQNLKSGKTHQVLLGVTGSGKTFTMASVIQKIQKPTLIISPNKTLAAQLYQEFKEFFPNNAVHYFVSYYDYYQPEAYIVQSDTYIEKDAKINEEIDRLRHSAAQDVLSRKDTIVIASVSCIYNIGSPENYRDVSLDIKVGQKMKRKDFLLHLTNLQYKRNDIGPTPGSFRARGDIIDIFLVTGENILKIQFSEEKISNIYLISSNFNSQKKIILKDYKIFPASFWVAPQNKINIALENI
ncbi:MAG: DEAD/DEAH box helicase family protein, partial [Candidatus Staskawiczbacteria bacterium]|nr:DEAD/DEAH box helicase family protein [Candidatus Staskawiczbacteria bacterium]